MRSDRPRDDFLTGASRWLPPFAARTPARPRSDAGHALCSAKRLAHVLRQIAGGQPSLLERRRPIRQVSEQLDVHEAMRPGALDLRSRHVATHREMRVQPLPVLVPLAGPEIREGLARRGRLAACRKNAADVFSEAASGHRRTAARTSASPAGSADLPRSTGAPGSALDGSQPSLDSSGSPPDRTTSATSIARVEARRRFPGLRVEIYPPVSLRNSTSFVPCSSEVAASAAPMSAGTNGPSEGAVRSFAAHRTPHSGSRPVRFVRLPVALRLSRRGSDALSGLSCPAFCGNPWSTARRVKAYQIARTCVRPPHPTGGCPRAPVEVLRVAVPCSCWRSAADAWRDRLRRELRRIAPSCSRRVGILAPRRVLKQAVQQVVVPIQGPASPRVQSFEAGLRRHRRDRSRLCVSAGSLGPPSREVR